MIKIIILFLVLSSNVKAEPMNDLATKLSNQVTSTQTIRMAILSFPYVDGFNSNGSRIVQERLITALAPNKKFSVLERALLGKVFKEKKLEMSGFFDEKTTTELGRMLGIQAVLTGTLINLSDTETEINARIINVTTGKIIASGKTTIPKIWKDRLTTPNPIFEPARLPEIVEVEVPQSDFKIEYADIEILEKYDEITKFDKSDALPLEKAGKWETFARSYSKYKDIAMKRAKEWKVYCRELKKAEKLKAQRTEAMNKDYQKLKRYLALTIISPEQKNSWAEKFIENYGTGTDNIFKDEISQYLFWIEAKNPMSWVDGDKYCKEKKRRLANPAELSKMYKPGPSGAKYNDEMHEKRYWAYSINSPAIKRYMNFGVSSLSGDVSNHAFYVRCVLPGPEEDAK